MNQGSSNSSKPGPPRGPYLAGKFADGTTGQFPLGDMTTLGRHPSNTVRLVDREVSKEHATIERMGRDFVLRDLGSSNGTFVNGRRVRELKLREGDEIALGSSRLIFHAGEPLQQVKLSGITIVAQSASAVLAQARVDQQQPQNFRPAEQIAEQALQREYEKLRIAYEFHRQVSQQGKREDLFERILKVSFELLAADHGAILKRDESGQFVTVAKEHRTGTQQVHVPVSATVLQKVVEGKEAVLIADPMLDERFSTTESIVTSKILSAMAVPLMAQQEVEAVLFLASIQQTNAFSEKDLAMLTGIAAQAGTVLENAKLAATRAELSRFLSHAVAEAVIRGKTEDLRKSQLAEVTVLFADIRGFTTLSESESPQEVVAMLNEFFTLSAGVVFRHEGNLDKFIGDCVMAVWGPPSPHPDDAARALRAALEILDAVETMNGTRRAQGKQPIEVGIGVNTGQAVVGYMGSSERHEFTAIGDTVNTASRLCGVAKSGEVIAAATTVHKAGGGFDAEPRPVAQVKGKEKGVAIYRVMGAEITSIKLR